MKKILIFSDTHGSIENTADIIYSSGKIDAVIHAGDYASDAEKLSDLFPRIPFYYVQGNNDYFMSVPAELNLDICGVRMFIAHGHKYRVKFEAGYRTLISRARSAEAKLTVFGHTHIPEIIYDGDMTVVNPGSARFSRTYAVAEIENGKVKASILDI